MCACGCIVTNMIGVLKAYWHLRFLTHFWTPTTWLWEILQSISKFDPLCFFVRQICSWEWQKKSGANWLVEQVRWYRSITCSTGRPLSWPVTLPLQRCEFMVYLRQCLISHRPLSPCPSAEFLRKFLDTNFLCRSREFWLSYWMSSNFTEDNKNIYSTINVHSVSERRMHEQ